MDLQSLKAKAICNCGEASNDRVQYAEAIAWTQHHVISNQLHTVTMSVWFDDSQELEG